LLARGRIQSYNRSGCTRLWSERKAWYSSKEGKQGQIKVGQFADFAVLSSDYFTVPEDDIRDMESVLTVLGGKVVHGHAHTRALTARLPVGDDRTLWGALGCSGWAF
jgi:hypothetical protein